MADEMGNRAMSPGGLQERIVRFWSCPWDVTAVQEDRLGTDCMEGFARHWKLSVHHQRVLVASPAGLYQPKHGQQGEGRVMFLLWVLGDTSGVLCLVWAVWDNEDCVRLNGPGWSGLDHVVCEEMLRELVLFIW